MISMHSCRPSASKPHDNAAKREQNPHYGHYNGLTMIRAVPWQRVEGLIIFTVGLALFWHWNDTMLWWGALLVFFAPDLSFLGYLLGPRTGAFCYNAVHIYAFGAASLAIGLMMPIPLLAVLGALWLAHSGFDGMLGYGLKSPKAFPLRTLAGSESIPKAASLAVFGLLRSWPWPRCCALRPGDVG